MRERTIEVTSFEVSTHDDEYNYDDKIHKHARENSSRDRLYFPRSAKLLPLLQSKQVGDNRYTVGWWSIFQSRSRTFTNPFLNPVSREGWDCLSRMLDRFLREVKAQEEGEKMCFPMQSGSELVFRSASVAPLLPVDRL